MALTLSFKRSAKLNYNVASTFLRNKTTSADTNDQQSVAEFYAGRSIFITGGTGFLGKIFIEKLLYSCPDIDAVYILIRDKRGQNTKERLQQMLNNPLYNRVKKFRPHTLKKIVPIVGDITKPDLAISPEDERILIDKVSVVFHSAATIKFFEPIEVAMNTNFEGTRRVINLSRRMKNLSSFVYISTAFSQTLHPVLEERVYPAPAKVDDIYEFMSKHKNDQKKVNQFISPRPNTYSFTKALSENYAATCDDLPVTILRPSIVASTLLEPEPGWLDNWFGMTGVATDIARGLNCYCIGRPDSKVDIIPVDYVTNLSLIAGAKYKRGNKVPVYNSATTGCNPVSLKTIYEGFIKENLKYGCYERPPHVTYFNSKFMLELVTFFHLKIPAYISDVLLRLKGDIPRHVTNLRRVLLTRYSMEYFIYGDWTFRVDAAQKLYRSLSKEDQAEFPCDPAEIDWDSFMKDYFQGVTTHLLPKQLEKEKAAITPKDVNKAVSK